MSLRYTSHITKGMYVAFLTRSPSYINRMCSRKIGIGWYSSLWDCPHGTIYGHTGLACIEWGYRSS